MCPRVYLARANPTPAPAHPPPPRYASGDAAGGRQGPELPGRSIRLEGGAETAWEGKGKEAGRVRRDSGKQARDTTQLVIPEDSGGVGGRRRRVLGCWGGPGEEWLMLAWSEVRTLLSAAEASPRSLRPVEGTQHLGKNRRGEEMAPSVTTAFKP